jgi:hypothetical protein
MLYFVFDLVSWLPQLCFLLLGCAEPYLDTEFVATARPRTTRCGPQTALKLEQSNNTPSALSLATCPERPVSHNGLMRLPGVWYEASLGGCDGSVGRSPSECEEQH